MVLNDTKSPLTSKTIWGALITLVPTLDTALTSLHILPTGLLTDGAKAIVGFVGAALAIYGRYKASKQIGG